MHAQLIIKFGVQTTSAFEFQEGRFWGLERVDHSIWEHFSLHLKQNKIGTAAGLL